jgi:hypothetical protein
MSLRSALASSSALAVLLFACPQAMAQDAPLKQFGDANQFALSLNHNLFVNQMDLLSGDELQASFFPVQGLSLGLAFGVQWWSDPPIANSSWPTASNMVLHVGPRVGYDFHFSPLVSFWPQVGVDYRLMTTWDSSPSPPASTSTQTSSAFGLSLMAPVLLHPSRGFFIGAGPAFYTESSNSSGDTTNGVSYPWGDNPKITSVGVFALIGGAI